MRTNAMLLVLAALALPGCEEAKSAANATGEALKAVGTAAADKTSDTALTVAVKSRLSDDEEVKSKLIHVDTAAGVVTLTGTQPTEEGHQHALDAARHVKGVVDVNDKIIVSK